VNTVGSYYCTCWNGYTLDARTNTSCFNKLTEFHCSYNFYPANNINTELCDNGMSSCIAYYQHINGSSWLLLSLTCIPPDPSFSAFCNESNCLLSEVKGHFDLYLCCCNQADCNNVSRVESVNSISIITTNVTSTPIPYQTQVVLSPFTTSNPWFFTLFAIFILSVLILTIYFVSLLFCLLWKLIIKLKSKT
jgi:hypothetical protein